jgi:hypothetical protein
MKFLFFGGGELRVQTNKIYDMGTLTICDFRKMKKVVFTEPRFKGFEIDPLSGRFLFFDKETGRYYCLKDSMERRFCPERELLRIEKALYPERFSGIVVTQI